jgi:hypothetical protein
MDEKTIKSQLAKFDEDLKKAKSEGEKAAIKERQEELKRQLKGMEKK